MASVLLTLAGVLTTGIASCQSSTNCNCIDYNQRIVENIVGSNAIIHYDELPLGSGVVYRKNDKLYVVTAAHVLEDESKIKEKYNWFCPKNFIEIEDNCIQENVTEKEKSWGTKEIQVTLFSGELESSISKEQGKMVFVDPKTDLAIIEIQEKNIFTKLIKGSLFEYNIPRMAEPVYIMGNPANDFMSITKGIIGNNNRSRVSLSEHVPFFYQTDADGAPGSSGGGLYKVDNGKCLGIVVMLNCRNFQVYSVPALVLRDTLIKNNKEELLPPNS